MTKCPDVVVEKFIKADAARIYRALTDAGELRRWFFTEARTDPRPGGEYRFRWRSAKEPQRDHDRFGKYLRLQPNALVEFEWKGTACDSSALMPDTVVTVTLSPQSGGTLVRLVHAGWPDTAEGRALRNSHEGGWTFYVENLAAYLSGGPDRRREHHGQLVDGD